MVKPKGMGRNRLKISLQRLSVERCGPTITLQKAGIPEKNILTVNILDANSPRGVILFLNFHLSGRKKSDF